MQEKFLEACDEALARDIRGVHKENPAYEHKRVAIELKINHKRVARVMRKFGTKPPRRKIKKKWITVSTDNHNYTNLIKNIIPDKPDFIFVSDLTYIKYWGQFIYLGGVGSKHDSVLALTTVKMAIPKRIPEIFHSDQRHRVHGQADNGFHRRKWS